MPIAIKRKYLFLYLAIACFAGMVAIFFVDGYLGIYDTVYVTAREYTEVIEADYWTSPYQYYAPVPGDEDSPSYCCIYTDAGENVSFRYRVENHQFSDYYTSIEASVWQQDEKVMDLFSEDVSISSFDEATVEWKLKSQDLEDAGYPASTRETQYTVKINHGDVERRIIVTFYNPVDILNEVK